ncbi:MAG: hypothetical protein M0002_13890 [Rhodospirillales bacterium]|nr:hypothetical protein [Rhodospirillales bacterium]
MRTSLISGLGALALVLGAASAGAAGQPPLTPTRDVSVTYQAQDPQGTVHVVHMSFDATGQRLRIDVIGQPGFLVIDRKAKRFIEVNAAAHAYVEAPLPPSMGNLMFRSPNMHLTRKGTARVAGLSCTVWALSAAPGSPGGEACITGDGVVLSGQPANGANSKAGIKATKVVYGPQPAALFVPPPGFQRIRPGLPPGAPGAPGAPPGGPALPPGPPGAAPPATPAPAKP